MWPLGSPPAVPVPWAKGPIIVVCVVFWEHCTEDTEGVSSMRLGPLLHALVSLLLVMGGGIRDQDLSTRCVRGYQNATASRPPQTTEKCTYKHPSAVCAPPEVSLSLHLGLHEPEHEDALMSPSLCPYFLEEKIIENWYNFLLQCMAQFVSKTI